MQRIKKRNNKQKHYYSGKKKRHTLKSQVVVDKKSRKVICTNFSNGKKHDFKLFKESRVRWTKGIKALTDSGYTGIQKIQSTTRLPKKKPKSRSLTKEEKQQNENVLGCLKRFKIKREQKRKRRKRKRLRFNLIAGIFNADLARGYRGLR